MRWLATLGDTRTYLRHWYRQAFPWVTRSQGTTSPVATISQQNQRPFKSPILSSENRDESNLSILSNNNRISALSDDSDPLVSSWSLWQCWDLQCNLLNILSLNENESNQHKFFNTRSRIIKSRDCYLPTMNPRECSCFSLIPKYIVHVPSRR